MRARERAAGFLTLDTHLLWIRTEKDPDSFGRWLGEIWWESDGMTTTVHLGDFLRTLNLASIWPTRWRDEYDKDAVS